MSKNWIFRFIIMLFVPIQIWFLFIMLNYPFLGFVVQKTDGEWVITQIDSRSQTSQLGLQVGDKIISVDGNDVGLVPSVIKWGTVDKVKKIIAVRDGTQFSADTSVLQPMTSVDVSYLVIEFICMIIAFTLFKWMNSSKPALCLAYLFFSIGMVFMSLGSSIRGEPLGKFTIMVGMFLVPTAFLHFLIVLLKEKGNLSLTHFLKFSYALIIICSLLQLPFFLNWQAIQAPYQYLTFTTLTFFVIGILFDFWLIGRTYYKTKKTNPHIATMIKTIGASFSVSLLPIVFFSFIPNILFGKEWLNSFYASWFILFFPLSFTYLLAAKKIYDIDMVVRRFILTTVVAIVPSAIIVAMISLLFSVKGETEHLILAFLLIVILLSATLYSLEYFNNRMEPIFFPRKHFLQASIKNIAKKLGYIHNIRELKEIILVDIVDILQVYGGAVIVRYQNFTETISEGEIDSEEAEALIKQGGRQHPSLTVFEITRNEEYSSHLVLTDKKTNTLLGAEEMQWLNMIISYLSVSMENLHLIRKLSVRMEQLASQIPNEEAGEFAWFRKIMFELQEKERSRIATDLHDTTMQDLFFLKRKLSTLFEQTRSEEPAASDAVGGLLDYIDVINMNLRQSCFELHPYLLQEVGLVGTTEKLLDSERMVTPFSIEFRSFGRGLIEGIDLDTKRHLFRVVQELLNNAKKHSQAHHVKFMLKGEPSHISLVYEDDGIGFEADRAVPWEIGGSRMGLEQIKSRILSLNGYYELITAPGKGMSLAATLPLQEGMTA